MRKFEKAAAAALIVLSQIGSSAFVVAQNDPASTPATTAPAAPANGAQAITQPAATSSSTARGAAKKSALSTPACSVRYLEAKIAGKLNGRTWADFRRDVCGASETTAVFPTAIAPKYSGEKDLEKALKNTCADQFTANKATDANGGLKWIEKDGGYYSECVSRLKG